MRFTPLVLLVVACSSDPDPTFHSDIQPMIERSCVQCHSPGNIAPFSLETYADVVEHAAAIEVAIRDRVMPPSPVDVSGACQTFRDAPYLTDDEIARFATWVDKNNPIGDPKDAPPPTKPPPPLAFDEERAMPEPYAPTTAPSDEYRCFVLDPIAASDRFLTAFEFVPQDARVVHHVLLFANETEAEDAAAIALDDRDPGPGYTCFGTAGENVGTTLLATWTPGSRAQAFDPGFGVRIAGGRKLVMQMHYNYASGVRPDQTRVKLRTAQGVDHEIFVALVDDGALVVPAGRAEAPYTWEIPLSDVLPVPMKVVFTAPHMHNYGRKARFEVVRENGKVECLTDTPRWDFHWQRTYDYAEQPELRPEDTLRMTCTYDTRERETPLLWGERTEDEMCMSIVGLTL
ncbi:MAG: hypothetical protein ACKV2T_34145 [Kofleriaceae bacterium]